MVQLAILDLSVDITFIVIDLVINVLGFLLDLNETLLERLDIMVVMLLTCKMAI